jgi:tetratricopeptide (TPR) repeat protein
VRHDLFGNTVTSEDPSTVAAINLFLREVLGYGNQAASIFAAATAAPSCALANAYAASLMMFMETGNAPGLAKPFLDAACAAPPPSEREAFYVEATKAWVEGHPEAMVLKLSEIVERHPRDLMALKLGQTLCFLLGDFEGMLRLSNHAIVAASDVGFTHGMHAFALEQNHRIPEAEEAALKALSLDRRDPWAQHAYAHTQETQGRCDEGIAFMRSHADTWEHCNSFMLTHNWWHVALYHIDREEIAEALALYDQRVWGVWKEYSQDQIGAISLLARLELRGVDVGSRWAELAVFLKARVNESVWPFNDLHYLYGLARAGEEQAVREKLARLQSDAHAVDPYIRRTWTEVTVPAARGLSAAGLGRHAQAVAELKPVMSRLQEVGGSHAQRDLFDLIFLDALEQAGEIARARAMVEKRIVDRRNIAWQHQLLARLH